MNISTNKITIIVLTIIGLSYCQLFQKKQALEGDPTLPEFEMQDKDTRIERFANTKFLKGIGKVKSNCGGKPCSDSSARDLPFMTVKKFPKHGEWKEWVQVKEKDKNDLKKEIFVTYYNSKGNYVNDERDGEWIEYHRTEKGVEKVAAVLPYKNGKRHGLIKSYDLNGNVSGEFRREDDLKQGVEKKYAPNGEILSETTYRDDKKNGPHFRKFFIKGATQLLEEGNYSEDEKTGVWKFYHPVGGKLKQVAPYVNDKITGKVVNYHLDGTTVAEEGMYNADVRTGIWKLYYESGNLQSEGNYSKRIQEKKSDPAYKRTGIWKEYYADGKLFAEGPRDHTRIGTWKFYYKNGQVRFKGKMKNEAMLEFAEIYDEKGKKLGEGKLFFSLVSIDQEKDEIKSSYRPDVPFTYYHDNGNKKLEILSQEKAIEYDVNGQKTGTGAIQNGKKNGCWNEGGKTLYYMMGRPNELMKGSCK